MVEDTDSKRRSPPHAESGRVVPHVISDALEPSFGQTLLWRNQRVTDPLPRLDDGRS